MSYEVNFIFQKQIVKYTLNVKNFFGISTVYFDPVYPSKLYNISLKFPKTIMSTDDLSQEVKSLFKLKFQHRPKFNPSIYIDDMEFYGNSTVFNINNGLFIDIDVLDPHEYASNNYSDNFTAFITFPSFSINLINEKQPSNRTFSFTKYKL